MKLAFVSNWDERCGNAEYARNLVGHIQKHSDMDVKFVGRPLSFEHVYKETRDVDVIHFNCVTPEFRELATEFEPWTKFKEDGKALTMMLQDNTQSKTERAAQLVYREDVSKPWQRVFDAIAVHAAPDEGCSYPSNVRVIPHGIVSVDVSNVFPERKIGTAGFPMPWKGFVESAELARRFGVGYLAIMPASHHIDVEQTKRKVLEICPKAEVVTDWLPHEQIIRRLAECFVNVYAYDLDYPDRTFEGISGAVRFGLAAKRPVIVSKNSLFRDLAGYPNEVYIIEQRLENTLVKVVRDWNDGTTKVPKKILEDMSWSRVACQYLEMWAHVANHWTVSV